jgi:putative flavoprotein involved in K+ transport
MVDSVDVLVIGAGSAGLAASYHLTQAGRDHLVVDRSRIGDGWRARWDSFTLVTPNWMSQLPGFPYDGDDPDGFMPRDDVVAYLEQYAGSFSAPVRLGIEVQRLERDDHGYVARMSNGELRASSVIVATGAFQRPRIPAVSTRLPASIHQIHSSHYRNPAALPAGAVVVVGSGQSGAQIAEELHESDRRVVLCVSRAGRVPRRYRGRDTTRWLVPMGFLDQRVEELEDPAQRFTANAHLSGKRGGHTINLHRCARDGVQLVGKIAGVAAGKLLFADDLHANLANADDRANTIRTRIDEFIATTKTHAPDPDPADDHDGTEGFHVPQIRELDLRSAGIATVVWATGYQPGFDWIDLDVIDERGDPMHRRGATPFAGLYFLGLHFLHKAKSGLLYGVGEDAAYLVERITEPDGALT